MPHLRSRARRRDRRAAFRKAIGLRSVAAKEDGDEGICSGGSISQCTGARIPVERIESRNICTSGKRRPVAPKGYAGRMICFRSPQGSIALDHLAGTAIADPDASRSSAERDIGGPARHVLPDPYSWFGSAGRPRVVFVAELLEHNLRCNKLGRDRNPGRSTPASGTGYTKRTGQSGLRIRVREDVHWACRNAAATSPFRSPSFDPRPDRGFSHSRPRTAMQGALGACPIKPITGGNSIVSRANRWFLTASARSLRRYGGRLARACCRMCPKEAAVR